MSSVPNTIQAAGSVSFEARAELSRNYIENAVDKVTGQPYFDVFGGNPVEFYHDWPDFGDLTARFWEAAYMIEDMTGKPTANVDKLGELLMSYFGENGLNYRPLTPYSSSYAELFDQARTLYALCTAYMATEHEKIAATIRRMVDGLAAITVTEQGYRYLPGWMYSGCEWRNPITMKNADDGMTGYYLGVLIRPLVKAWHLLGCQVALDLATDLTRFVIERAKVFGPNGEFDGHIHGRMATAAGIYTCGKATGNREWMEVARKAWDYARVLSGPCGFTPECIYESNPIRRSETCAIMDYLDLTLVLAADGDESKWGEAERILRNHLIESQLTTTNWATGGPARLTDELSTTEAVAERMIGGFAGWSALDHLFAMVCRFNEEWIQSYIDPKHYVGKLRLFQNCCGPAGPRGIYQAWSQALVWHGDTLRANMLVNRRIAGAEVCVREATDGVIEVRVSVDRDCDLSLRMPEWLDTSGVTLTKNGKPGKFERTDYRLLVKVLRAGDEVTANFPYSITQETYTVNHLGGYTPEDFVITFRGDSAIRVEKVGGGLTPEQSAELCPIPYNPPLYQRRAEDIYAAEPQPRVADAKMNWY